MKNKEVSAMMHNKTNYLVVKATDYLRYLLKDGKINLLDNINLSIVK